MEKAADRDGITHSSGLGVMPSMSAECTPLKHRYDACFNRWFEEYLGLPPPVASSSSSTSSSATSDASSDSGVSGFFSRKSSGRNTEVKGADPIERKKLRDRLEGECGSMWKEYQGCVLRAVKAKDLEALIEEARIQNPFPFPQDRISTQPNNEPFPFPAATTTSKDTQ